MSTPDRRAMLDRDHPTVSIRGQCRLLGLARSGVYRPAACERRRRSGADAADRRTVHRLAVPRLAADDGDAAGRGAHGQPQAGAAADAGDGDRGSRAEAENDEAGAGAQDLPVPAARPDDRPAEPGVGGGHHLHPDGRGFLYLVAIIDWASRAVLAWRLSNTMDVGVLPRGARRGAGAVRQAGDLQHRPGLAVHQRRLHRPAGERRHSDLHGRPRPLDGQRVHRAAVAIAEVRGRLPEGLRRRPRGAAGIAAWIDFYNGRRPHQALAGRTPMAVWREGITGAAGRQRRGHDAALGRRSRVAHMPTATTATAADASSGVIEEVGAGQPSNQERWSSGPADGVHFNPSTASAAAPACG